MKKLFIILTMALSLGIVGCSNVNIEESTNKEKSITISKENFDKIEEMKDRVQGNSTGIYKVNNLEKGKYKVIISMEEYNDGKLKESQNSLIDEVELKNNKDNLYIGINKNKDNVMLNISQIGEDNYNSSTSNIFSLSEDEEKGYMWSILENNGEKVHKIQLDKEISIASFSVGKDGTTYGINVGEDTLKPSEYDFSGQINAKDIVVYLKISKIV